MNATRSVLLAVLVVAAAVAPVAGATTESLAVGVTQADDGTASVTVTDNGTGVENATVEVTADNATYDGEGTYTTDSNGTVDLPAPAENVTVTVTATYENATASTTVELVAGNGDESDEEEEEAGGFGAEVAAYVMSLLEEDGPGLDGSVLADFVTESNPGNAPDHAGPDAGNETAGNETDAPGNGNGPGDNPGNGQGNGNGNGQANDSDE